MKDGNRWNLWSLWKLWKPKRKVKKFTRCATYREDLVLRPEILSELAERSKNDTQLSTRL
ncbi:hypothetical protein CU663_09695 [Pseudomonas syringae pv. actinidifoliorum]|nr:hypothetical protein [Pseudomonas syringae pv. actinidifoliorum]